jgi:hypothetical protein
MNEQWKNSFLGVMRRNDVEQEKEFLHLVDQVRNRCNLDVARTLMKSFLGKPDYGTQERVISVLASADRCDAIRALLEELPRLIKEAPEWAETLTGQEVDRRPELLAEVAKSVSDESVRALQTLLFADSFRESYPNAKKLVV